jgi:hypothetical protein
VAYPTAADVAAYLDNVNLDDPEQAAALETVTGRARSIVDEALKPVVFDEAWPAEASEKTVVARYGPYLPLPPHRPGSVSRVAFDNLDLAGQWVELESGVLLAQDVAGIVGDWGYGPYRVTAVWGYGPPPDAVGELVVEVAVNIWRHKHEGLFVERPTLAGGARMEYVGGLTESQQALVSKIARNYRPLGV